MSRIFSPSALSGTLINPFVYHLSVPQEINNANRNIAFNNVTSNLPYDANNGNQAIHNFRGAYETNSSFKKFIHFKG